MSGRLWRVMVPLALLILIGTQVDVPSVALLLAGADGMWLLLAWTVVQAQVLLSAYRWQITARALGQMLSRRRAVVEYYIATLLNQLLPGGVTGDAARIVRNRRVVGAAASARSVVIERLAGQLALLLVTASGLLFWPMLVGGGVPADGLRLMASVVGVAVLLVALVKVSRRLLPMRWQHFVDSVGPSLRQAWLAGGAWWRQGLLSLLIVGSYLAVFALCALALDAPLALPALLTVVPLALLTMLVPLSIGGWGLREAAAAALWPLVGLSAETGVATSIAYGLISLAGALPALPLLAQRQR